MLAPPLGGPRTLTRLSPCAGGRSALEPGHLGPAGSHPVVPACRLDEPHGREPYRGARRPR